MTPSKIKHAGDAGRLALDPRCGLVTNHAKVSRDFRMFFFSLAFDGEKTISNGDINILVWINSGHFRTDNEISVLEELLDLDRVGLRIAPD